MRVWRLCRAKHAATAFDGEGARLFGGRWNEKGVPVVYASATLSLAALEVLVHHRVPLPPQDFVAISADFPQRVRLETIEEARLPRDWQADPPPRELQQIGSEWARSLRSLVLVVPSALISQEFNYLINPRHPAFARLKIAAPKPFPFDPRLWRV
ncbi:MAG: RES family NAD+ phosphorylase [Blastocatellia bacterium]